MTDTLFTTEQVKEDGRSRVAKTVGQGGLGTAAVTIGQAVCQARGWMHGELDPVVFGAYVVVVTGVAAAVMNLSKLRGRA